MTSRRCRWLAGEPPRAAAPQTCCSEWPALCRCRGWGGGSGLRCAVAPLLQMHPQLQSCCTAHHFHTRLAAGGASIGCLASPLSAQRCPSGRALPASAGVQARKCSLLPQLDIACFSPAVWCRFATVEYLLPYRCPSDYEDVLCGGGTGQNTCNGDSGGCCTVVGCGTAWREPHYSRSRTAWREPHCSRLLHVRWQAAPGAAS